MADVVCLGILVADVVGKPVETLPERGKLTLVDRMELHTGGNAANSGIGLAKIGIDVAVIGKVGDDGFGDFMVNRLERNGIDTHGVVRDKEVATSATMVMVHKDGERSFIHYLGANAALVESDIDYSIIEGAKVLDVTGTFLLPGIDGEPTARILKKARAMGVTTALDSCWDSKGQWMTLLEPCLPYLDYALPSLNEAQMVTGKEAPADVAQVLLDKGVRTVGLKLGEDGCYIRNADTEFTMPPFVVECQDALGAGDSWVAGFLTGVVKGWSLEETARFANAVGASCVTALGATTGIKSLAETQEFMKNTPVRA